MGLFILREGDKVMQIRNNYDKMVFNGEHIGRGGKGRSWRSRRSWLRLMSLTG